MRGVYTYEELARIENRKRTTYYLYSCGQEGQDNCQGVQGLGSLATKTCQCLGTRKLSYDAHAKPGDTGDEVRPSRLASYNDKIQPDGQGRRETVTSWVFDRGMCYPSNLIIWNPVGTRHLFYDAIR